MLKVSVFRCGYHVDTVLRMSKWDSLIRNNVAAHAGHVQQLEDVQAVHDVVALLSIDSAGGSQVLWCDLGGCVEVVVPFPGAVLLEPHL